MVATPPIVCANIREHRNLKHQQKLSGFRQRHRDLRRTPVLDRRLGFRFRTSVLLLDRSGLRPCHNPEVVRVRLEVDAAIQTRGHRSGQPGRLSEQQNAENATCGKMVVAQH